MIRPGRGDITTTRLDRYTASGIEWVTKITVVPVLGADAQQLGLHVLAGHLVERAERLVHQQQRRVGSEGAGDRDALLHATRELPRHVAGELGQLDQFEHLGSARSRRLARSQPFSSSGSSMFLATVRHSNRPACWNAIP